MDFSRIENNKAPLSNDLVKTLTGVCMENTFLKQALHCRFLSSVASLYRKQHHLRERRCPNGQRATISIKEVPPLSSLQQECVRLLPDISCRFKQVNIVYFASKHVQFLVKREGGNISLRIQNDHDMVYLMHLFRAALLSVKHNQYSPLKSFHNKCNVISFADMPRRISDFFTERVQARSQGGES